MSVDPPFIRPRSRVASTTPIATDADLVPDPCRSPSPGRVVNTLCDFVVRRREPLELAQAMAPGRIQSRPDQRPAEPLAAGTLGDEQIAQQRDPRSANRGESPVK